MQLDFKVTISEEYFSQVGKKIDWDENDKRKASIEQASLIQSILATEVSIFLLRRTAWVDWSLVDNMVGIRRNLIDQYENDYEPYVEYNDFY